MGLVVSVGVEVTPESAEVGAKVTAVGGVGVGVSDVPFPGVPGIGAVDTAGCCCCCCSMLLLWSLKPDASLSLPSTCSPSFACSQPSSL